MVLTSFALAACGGGGTSGASPGDVFREFAQAAAAENGNRLWELLSERMKADVSRHQFTSAILPRLRDDYLPVASGRTLLDVELDDEVALAALEGKRAGPGALAAVLRRESGGWRVQLSELDLVYGSGNLDFQVNARREDRALIDVRAWVDGAEAAVKRDEGSLLPTFRVRANDPLERGRHSVVAYAEAGPRSGAIAWTFDR
jgi:hypothetical protein